MGRLDVMNSRFDPTRFAQAPPKDVNEMPFDERLDATHEWPCPYVFKFIMRPPQLFDFQKMFPEETWTTRESRGGKFISVTMKKQVASSREVIKIYAKAQHIPGVMML